MHHDVILVGGGPAGLSAALMFGRARKRALLLDAGPARNALAAGVHNFVTRDGISPRDFRAAAHADLRAYPSVEAREARAVDVVRDGEHLRVTLEDGTSETARRVLLSTGIVDVPPPIPGLAEVWGTSAFQCPYCHGWEGQDQPWGVLVPTDAFAPWALLLLGWTSRLTVFTDGRTLSPEVLAQMTAAGVRVETEAIARLHSDGGHLRQIELHGGAIVPATSLFLRPEQRPTAIVTRLGLALDDQGFVKVDEMKESSMPGVHVAGDATTLFQGAVAAAAAGTMAAAMMNHGLTHEDVVARLR
ncbi:MAG: NAD(P)/FAD-dependent oxidoreductase [Pseudomonadota bacterium]|nr:NAD(P)/FAD-dependent oxidoreductase [Pseudomonadota bacterium]